MVGHDFIRPSKTLTVALVMFVKRFDEKLRLVVDYQGSYLECWIASIVQRTSPKSTSATPTTKFEFKHGMSGKQRSCAGKVISSTKFACKGLLMLMPYFNIL